MTDPFVVRDANGLSDARRAFLQAVESGEGHLEIELPARCLGIDEVTPDLELVTEDARAPAPIDVTLRSRAGLCVLTGLGVRIAARSVRLEGVAVVAAPGGSAIDVTAEHSLRLRDVIVLGTPAPVARSTPVALRAAGSTGTTAAVESSVIAGTPASGRDRGFTRSGCTA